MKPSNRLWLAVACAVGIAFPLAGLWHELAERAPSAGKPDRRDFTLSDVDGKDVTLATFGGKWVLLYFGYTFCPDICPTSLQVMGEVADTLRARGEAMQPVFITVDPERDTPQVLRDYVSNFGGAIVGLTGSIEQIGGATRRYGTFFQKQPMPNGSYMMNHSSGFSLISPKGAYVRVFRSDLEANELFPEVEEAMHAWKD